MKRKTTKEILAESFKELAAVRKIDRITVREITDNCQYSPATFCRHFKDKYDLIDWDCAQTVEERYSRIVSKECSWHEIWRICADYHEENREQPANLLRHTPGMNSFERYMTEVSYKYMLEYMENSGEKVTEADRRYLMVYCLGGVRYTTEWILGSISATAAEMADVYENTIPAPLRHFFNNK